MGCWEMADDLAPRGSVLAWDGHAQDKDLSNKEMHVSIQEAQGVWANFYTPANLQGRGGLLITEKFSIQFI